MPCSAEITGEGYWTCDVIGGCFDCRRLAKDIHDVDMLTEWKEEEKKKLKEIIDSTTNLV